MLINDELSGKTINATYVRGTIQSVIVDQYVSDPLVTSITIDYTDEEDFPANHVATKNLSGYGMFPQTGHVFIPDYSEHEGLPAELARLGIIDPDTMTPVYFGYAQGVQAALTPEYSLDN